MNNIITAAEAYTRAVRLAGLENSSPVPVSAVLNNGFYELTVRINLQRFEFYVDAFTGEVPGINCEPVLDMAETLCYNFEKNRHCA